MRRKVYLDFETYYDRDYSLRKLTTEEYVRADNFHTIMMSYKEDDSPTEIAVGREAIEEALRRLRLDQPGTITVAHNAHFEGAVLEWRFGVKVNMLVCTMAMARVSGVDRLSRVSLEALAEFFHQEGEEDLKGDEIDNMMGMRLEDFDDEGLKAAVEYCLQDTNITHKIFHKMLPLVPPNALDMIDMTMRMFTRPMFKVDAMKLMVYRNQIITNKQALLDEVAEATGLPRDNVQTLIRSPKRFPILFKNTTGRELPYKVSDARTATFRKKLEELTRDGNGAAVEELKQKTEGLRVENGEYVVYSPATAKDDLEFQDLLVDRDPMVKLLAKTKLENSSTIHETRAQRMMEISGRGLLPAELIFASAHTGRYGGGGKINLQNLPSRGDRTIRESLGAPRGYSIIAGDSSQIEARLLAYAANQRDILDIFATGGDVYAYMGSSIYNIPYEDIVKYRSMDPTGQSQEIVGYINLCKIARDVGKEAVLASGYQMSGRSFALRLKSTGVILSPIDGRELEGEEIDKFHDEEAQRINDIYRNTNHHITGFWRRCQSVLYELVAGGKGYFGGPNDDLFYYGHRNMYGKRVPGIMLPNGFWVLYPNLRVDRNEETGFEEFTYRAMDKGGWRTMYVYGGKVTENIIQSLAFAVLQEQAQEIRDRGVPIVLNIHDEWASIVSDENVETAVKIFEEAMSRVPAFVAGCPLDCEVSYGKHYGEV